MNFICDLKLWQCFRRSDHLLLFLWSCLMQVILHFNPWKFGKIRSHWIRLSTIFIRQGEMSCELLKNYCSNLIHESRVFYFARDGMAMSLYTILADLDLEQVRKLLNKVTFFLFSVIFSSSCILLLVLECISAIVADPSLRWIYMRGWSKFFTPKFLHTPTGTAPFIFWSAIICTHLQLYIRSLSY